MANVEFGTGKTVVILSIVAACFAVLWPKIFYPMITGVPNKNLDSDGLNGCCDVLFETDINVLKIINEMCGTILNRQGDFKPKLSLSYQPGRLTKEIINMCRTEVMNSCGIDIAEFLKKKERLGQSYKHMLDEIRSFNISICLRQNFGVNPGLLGAPRRMRIWETSSPRHLKQERPLHFRPEIMHPALREKGRAIPQTHVVSKTTSEKDKTAQTLPVSNMRPPMGGAGHVVPPPKVGGTMSVVMPLYTIGIVIFFMYTVMKVFMKKSGESDEFKDFRSDPEFRRVVFSEDYSSTCAQKVGENVVHNKEKEFTTPQVWKSPTDDSTRLGWKERYTIMSAITGLLTEVDQQLERAGDTQTQYSTELKDKKNLDDLCNEEMMSSKKEVDLLEQLDVSLEQLKAKINQADNRLDAAEKLENNDTAPKVKVVGLEMMAKCEGGQKWSRPATPNLGVSSHNRVPSSPPYEPEPQNIFLEGALPQQSQVLVSDSKTQAFTIQDENEPESPVILSSKMTLSLISLDTPLDGENNRLDLQPPQSIDVKSEDDNVGSADSTLLDIDSELIDDSGQVEYDSSFLQEQQVLGNDTERENEIVNEVDDDLSKNYTTASMSGRAEVGIEPDLEDTAADLSNLDNLELTEDQEGFQNQEGLILNGNIRESINRSQGHSSEPEEEN